MTVRDEAGVPDGGREDGEGHPDVTGRWEAALAGEFLASPAGSACPGPPASELRECLRTCRTRAAMPRVTLAGLAVACGLGSRLLPYGPSGARRHLDDAVAALPPALAGAGAGER